MQTSRNGKRIVKIFIIIFVLSWYIPLLIASAIEGWMLYTTLDTKNKIENNEFQQIEAIVIDYDVYYDRDFDSSRYTTTYGIICEYEMDGEYHEYYGNFYTNLDILPPLNSTITLYYDADSGKIYEEFSKTGSVNTFIFMLVITTIMEIAPLIIILVIRKQRKKHANTINMYPEY